MTTAVVLVVVIHAISLVVLFGSGVILSMAREHRRKAQGLLESSKRLHDIATRIKEIGEESLREARARQSRPGPRVAPEREKGAPS